MRLSGIGHGDHSPVCILPHRRDIYAETDGLKKDSSIQAPNACATYGTVYICTNRSSAGMEEVRSTRLDTIGFIIFTHINMSSIPQSMKAYVVRNRSIFWPIQAALSSNYANPCELVTRPVPSPKGEQLLVRTEVFAAVSCVLSRRDALAKYPLNSVESDGCPAL